MEDAGFKRKARWFLKVLDRNDGGFKLLEIGPQIYNGIRQLVQDPDWGRVTSYDLIINRAKPGTQPLYSVSPRPKNELEGEYQEAFIEFNDGLTLDRLIKPADPQYVMEVMGWSSNKTASSATSEEEDFPFDFNS